MRLQDVQLNEGKPQVGLFWIEPNGEIVGLGSSDIVGNEVVKSGDVINYNDHHGKYWPKDFNEKYPGKSQRDFDKGRVSKNLETRRFLVELPTKYEGNAQIQSKVMKYFNLSRQITDFEYFPHHDSQYFNKDEYK